MDYERLVLDHLPVVEQIVGFIARRQRLTPEEAEELSSAVRLKLLEEDHRVLRQFEGRSNLRTYLTAVVNRLALDARTARWGKWRPSAQARRLGPVAVDLDRLLNRDGSPLEEAIEGLRNHGVTQSETELRALAEQLPSRSKRRFVSDEQLASVAGPPPDRPADVESVRKGADRIEHALFAALARLSDEDRLILKMRFQGELTVARIARLMGLDQKTLYRRLHHIMGGLRHEMESRGVGPAEVSEIVGHPATDLSAVMERGRAGNPPSRPSIR